MRTHIHPCVPPSGHIPAPTFDQRCPSPAQVCVEVDTLEEVCTSGSARSRVIVASAYPSLSTPYRSRALGQNATRIRPAPHASPRPLTTLVAMAALLHVAQPLLTRSEGHNRRPSRSSTATATAMEPPSSPTPVPPHAAAPLSLKPARCVLAACDCQLALLLCPSSSRRLHLCGCLYWC